MEDISCNLKGFKRLLKNFLYSDSFYALEEYFQYNNNNNNNNNNVEFGLEKCAKIAFKRGKSVHLLTYLLTYSMVQSPP